MDEVKKTCCFINSTVFYLILFGFQFRKSFSFLLREGWRVVGACCVSLVFTCGENSFASLPLLFPRNPFHWACAGAIKLRQRYRQPSGTGR